MLRLSAGWTTLDNKRLNHRVPMSREILMFVCLQKDAKCCCDAMKIDHTHFGHPFRQLNVLVAECCATGFGFESRVDGPRIKKIGFH